VKYFKLRYAAGFTLIELLISVAIIAILAAVAMPLAELSEQRTKEQELRGALREIREGIDAYKRAADEGRVARSPDQSGYPPALAALIEGVTDATSPIGAKIYFMRRIPRNPFAEDAGTNPQAGWGKRGYESPPDAPKEGKDVFDVHALTPRVGLNGIPYRQW
jgi:general secretion pathway protein G